MFKKIFKGESLSRVFETKVNRNILITPEFIPAFSSREDRSISNRIKIMLNNIPQPASLISAYDYKTLGMTDISIAEIIKSYSKGKMLFLDSGAFELQFDINDKWDEERYVEAITEIKPSFFVSYDRIPRFGQKFDILKDIEKSVDFLRRAKMSYGRILLIHLIPGKNIMEEIDGICRKLIEYNNDFDIVGFPEKEMGSNIIQRCIFIRRIRDFMDKSCIEKPVHIFGCSDPTSILLFVLSGADMFDGLGWIKYCNSGIRNIDKSHLPLLNCRCFACKDVDWRNIQKGEYEYRLSLHNLMRFTDFTSVVRDSIIKGNLIEYIKINRIIDNTLLMQML